MHTKFGRQYDFIFKGDDDTHVNLPQMRRLLSSFDPDVPVFVSFPPCENAWILPTLCQN